MGWDDNVPWTCTNSSLGMWWDGWDDNLPSTCTHSRLRVVGRVSGWGDGMMNVPCGGMDGVGGMLHLAVVTCTHTRAWVEGVRNERCNRSYTTR